MTTIFAKEGSVRYELEAPNCPEIADVWLTIQPEPVAEFPVRIRWTRKGRKLLRHLMRNTTPMKLRRIRG